MRTLVVDHPLVTHKLTALRDTESDTATFRSLTAELVTLLAYEATREMRVQPVSVTTPVGMASGVKLAGPVPLIVPVLRAGIGMLDGMTRLLPARASASGLMTKSGLKIEPNTPFASSQNFKALGDSRLCKPL